MRQMNADFGEELKSAGFNQGGFNFFQICLRHNAETFFESYRRQRADGLDIGDGFRVEKRQMTERHFQFTATILPGDRNVDDERARSI